MPICTMLLKEQQLRTLTSGHKKGQRNYTLVETCSRLRSFSRSNLYGCLQANLTLSNSVGRTKFIPLVEVGINRNRYAAYRVVVNEKNRNLLGDSRVLSKAKHLRS